MTNKVSRASKGLVRNTRTVRVPPLPVKVRKALVQLVKSEHKPIVSDAICGPGWKRGKR